MKQVVGERGEGEDVGRADEGGKPERHPPAAWMLVLELAGGGHEHAEEQGALERGDEPRRADRESRRQQQLKADGGEDGRLRRPEGLRPRRGRVGARGQGWQFGGHPWERRGRVGTNRRPLAPVVPLA